MGPTVLPGPGATHLHCSTCYMLFEGVEAYYYASTPCCNVLLLYSRVRPQRRRGIMDYPDYIILRIRLYYVLPGWGVWVLWIIRIILDYGLILNTYCRTLPNPPFRFCSIFQTRSAILGRGEREILDFVQGTHLKRDYLKSVLASAIFYYKSCNAAFTAYQ